MKKSLRLTVVLAMVLVLLLTAFGAYAAPTSEAVVTLSSAQTEFAAAQEVVLSVTIANPTRHTIKVLKWYTPVEGVEEPLFTVLRDGEAVSYLGAIYKRPAPAREDYLFLKAKQSITVKVRLSDYYDLSQSGEYQVVYNVGSLNLSSDKSDGSGKGVERMGSNPLFLKVEGRVSGPILEEAIAPLAVTGGTTFNKCTTARQSTLITARSEASGLLANSYSYLQAGNKGARYTTWFGIFDTSRYSVVTNNFSKIKGAMDTASVKFDCSCKKRYYAYVYPTQPYNIYLCAAFWTAPMLGTDSKAGTLIHEMSHFNVVVGTDDYVYGQAGAKNLAITNPAQAIDNADNHEYFAENTPALP